MKKFNLLKLALVMGLGVIGAGTIGALEAKAECVTGVGSTDSLNVRSGPGTNYPVIARLRPDACGIKVYAYKGKWAHISRSNGYVASRFLIREDDGGDAEVGLSYDACVRNVRSNDVLNIRFGPSSKSNIVGSIPPNACDVSIISGYPQGRNGFFRVRYKGVFGWASKKFLYFL